MLLSVQWGGGLVFCPQQCVRPTTHHGADFGTQVSSSTTKYFKSIESVQDEAERTQAPRRS
ncbi:hypothetical protein BV22DRAFT_1039046 [Leucogyrophana mollusca]|uniref:Uncharacterized protein n=1 Tax=Leucogyrophana mollusca TaxID=85980 RepID=A0ACB8B6S5_9AGAM|nr:hypothetical protein BV22DRAFT_1039046 [Leucogyrophana mollusca]